MAKSGLGRGLDSLFDPEGLQHEGDIVTIPLVDIQVNPHQPRKTFREEELQEMVESLATHGILQPVIVTRIPDRGDGYFLVAGERRFRAATRLGWEGIPAILKDIPERNLLEIALVENLQRADLNPVEIAVGLNQLIEECTWTQEQVAKHLGMKRPTIANYLRILALPPETLGRIESGELNMGHAKVLLGIKDPQWQREMETTILEEGLSVRGLEQSVGKKKGVRKVVPSWVGHRQIELTRTFGRSVKIRPGKKSFQVVMEIRNEEDLDGLIRQWGISGNGSEEKES